MFDVVTYALCKKLISESSTGISKIEVNENGDLVFTMADGQTIVVDMPIKMDCIDFKFVTTLPISDISPTTVYIQATARKDEEGNIIYRQYMWVNEAWRYIGISGEPIATYDEVGLVKPDGESILINEDGTISVDPKFILDIMGEELVEEVDIDKLFK